LPPPPSISTKLNAKPCCWRACRLMDLMDKRGQEVEVLRNDAAAERRKAKEEKESLEASLVDAKEALQGEKDKLMIKSTGALGEGRGRGCLLGGLEGMHWGRMHPRARGSCSVVCARQAPKSSPGAH
jgi:hypothetical protein